MTDVDAAASSWPTGPTGLDDVLDVPPAPPRLGRYAILRTIGAGGMGVVYAAYDEELARRVAIKVLHPNYAADLEQRARILREAQAMAKVSHPNVVAIHEVDVAERRVFVVMEFVDGPTLGAWQSAARRSEREILEVYVQAGRGLAAAHAAGLVHRDFKPDNVLVARDGRVRVVDFGLARASGTSDPGGTAATSSPSLLMRPLTRPGALAGTPAYMSPEQHGSAAFDARSDQYAFCVALWEALMGERPFAGDTVTALMHSVRSGQFQRPAVDREVSSWVIEALRRGLSAEPERRWPAMVDLLSALMTDPSGEPAGAPRSRRRFVGVMLATGFVCTLAAAVSMADRGEQVTLTLSLLPSLVVLTVIGALALVQRRTLLRSRYDRRVIAVFVMTLATSAGARAIGWFAGMSAAELLVVDLVVEGATYAMAGLFVARWYTTLAPLTFAAALVVALQPTHAVAIATGFFPVLMLVTVTLWSRAARSRRRQSQ